MTIPLAPWLIAGLVRAGGGCHARYGTALDLAVGALYNAVATADRHSRIINCPAPAKACSRRIEIHSLTDQPETVLPTLLVKLTPSDTIALELTRGDLIRDWRRAIRPTQRRRPRVGNH